VIASCKTPRKSHFQKRIINCRTESNRIDSINSCAAHMHLCVWGARACACTWVFRVSVC